VGTVQGLDGERHHRRKAMFLSLLGPDQVEELAAELARQWRYRLPSWEVREHVVQFDEMGEMLVFDPDRFTHWADDRYTLIPQGGGDHATGHRCPGEWAVLAVMRTAVRMLSTEMTYQLPEQDLTVRLARLPALLESRVLLTNIRPATLRSEPGMVDPDPMRHPFTTGYEPLGGGAGAPHDSAPPPPQEAPADNVGIPDHEFADRLPVDPDRGEVTG
jgi:hypothetical protein